MLNKGKEMPNSLREYVKTTSGSGDGSGEVLEVTGVGLFRGTVEIILVVVVGSEPVCYDSMDLNFEEEGGAYLI